jgi:hypothetical protein
LQSEAGTKSIAFSYHLELEIAELVNLQLARKRAKRRQDEKNAAASRLVHGRLKHRRKQQAAARANTARRLDQHRIEREDGL